MTVAKNILFTIVIAALVILGLLLIWNVVLPILNVVIGDFFGSLLGSFVSFVGSLF